MTQEDKELLLRDLCARLTYGVKVHVEYIDLQRDGKPSSKDIVLTAHNIQNFEKYWSICKPYLRPMSSMTEEEIKELLNIDKKRWIFSSRHLTWHLDGEVTDYLNKKMFDWRELISKGLALEAPEGMYDKKEE